MDENKQLFSHAQSDWLTFEGVQQAATGCTHNQSADLSMNLQRSYHERRSFGRRSTNIRASVRIGYRFVPCTISDLSEGGARLELDEEVELTARLWLSWDEQPSEILCELRHQRGKTAGVQFSRPIVITARAAAEPSAPLPAAPLQRAPRGQAREAASSASMLIANRRACLRAANGQADTAALPVKDRVSAPSDLARSNDLSPGTPESRPAMPAGRECQAEPLLAQHAVCLGPAPAPPKAYRGAVIDPPPAPYPHGVPLPLAAASYRTGTIQNDLSPLDPPAPLPARCYASADCVEIRLPVAAGIGGEPPWPLAVWHYRVVLAPLPLAAAAYGI